MAKKNPAQPSESGSAIDISVAATRALCAVTGCGIATAQKRLAALPAEIVQRIADAETSGDRQSVPSILSTVRESNVSDPAVPAQGQGPDAGSGG